MSSNKGFFELPQAAAVYKHKLLKTYIPAWAGKVGSTATGKRVVVYDAYSGPGRYANNEPGSPELLVNTAVEMAKLRQVHSVFSEKDQKYCDRLMQMLVDKGIDPSTYEVRQGPVETHLDEVLTNAGDSPLFVFLDPFGLTISFDRVVHVLKSRDKAGYSHSLQPKTELLMNFSYEAIRRIAGALRTEKEYAAKEGQIGSLDEALGSDWWHQVAREEKEGWVQQILTGYAGRVGKAAGYGYITAAVADSLTAQPVYELILFTRHRDGLWEMANAMSYGRRDWRQWLVDEHEKAVGGQVEFRGLDFEDDEAAWIAQIAANVEAILDTSGSFIVDDKLAELLGSTMGLARETHIRKALKSLKARGAIATVPTGSLQRAYIARG